MGIPECPSAFEMRLIYLANNTPILQWVADQVRSRFLARLLSFIGTTGVTFQPNFTPATSFSTNPVRLRQRVDTSHCRIAFRALLVKSIPATSTSAWILVSIEPHWKPGDTVSSAAARMATCSRAIIYTAHVR